jgi:Tol biopolymer transport system component
MKKIFTLLLLANTSVAFAQKLDTLTVEKIMRDPKWIGVSPSDIHWSDDSKKILFKWNIDKTGPDELFAVTPADTTPQKVSVVERRSLPAENGSWNKKHTQKVFEKNGDLFLEDLKSGKTVQLTRTAQRESSPVFNGAESRIIFSQGSNLFAINVNGSGLEQLTNFVKSKSKKAQKKNPINKKNGLKSSSWSCLILLRLRKKRKSRIRQRPRH